MTYEEAVEQMTQLDQRLGEGVGATKERARLQKIIDAQHEQLEGKSTTTKRRRKRK